MNENVCGNFIQMYVSSYVVLLFLHIPPGFISCVQLLTVVETTVHATFFSKGMCLLSGCSVSRGHCPLIHPLHVWL